MPEYLAPGVYVEETSFRARSIEGVSTSTTAFVGPTRTGPVGDTPELLTSFGDFQRIYGGLGNLSRGLNHVAHAVRAYFDNGGSRLYVARVFQPAGDADTGAAQSPPIVDGGTEATRARFVARFPGAAGNGRVILREASAPVTRRSMDGAPAGSLVRLGGEPARGARLEGGPPPFAVANDGRLLLTVDGADAAITFHGEAATVTGTAGLPADVTLDEASRTLAVTIDGVAQSVALPAGPTPRAALVDAINAGIRGGFARVTAAGDPGGADRLVIGSDRRGRLASVTVVANAGLNLPAATARGADVAANNVGDLGRVTADEIDALLVAGAVPARAALDPVSGRLVLTTVATGAAARLAVRDGAGSVHAALGLAAGGAPAAGVAGAEARFFVKGEAGWFGRDGAQLDLTGVAPGEAPGGRADLLTLNARVADADGNEKAFEELGLHPDHPRFIGHVLAVRPTRRIEALENLVGLDVRPGVTAFALRDGLFPAGADRVVTLSGGNDGAEPNQAAFEPALRLVQALEDVSIVAAPGHSTLPDFAGVQQALITHAEQRRAYRIVVLDTPPGSSVTDARTVRARIDSTRAALYHPWVIVSNPLARPGAEDVPREIALPPSGFVCGIYARTDVERGVHKAPANEVVRGALRFETEITFGQQELLNPLGVNCLRSFVGRGHRVWGARTASSDPEWKYVNVRRYFNYLEASIDRGTQFAVFEPNGERLWASIRETIASFLYNEWFSGALLGATPREAFFVRCDRSTMTQNDLDNGRLIVLVGVAALKPAEFVIFRIGQKTADARQ